MKILRVIRSIDPKGGGPIEGLKQSSTALQKLGHETEILSLDAPNEDYIVSCEWRVHAKGPGWKNFGYHRDFYPWLLNNLLDFDAVIIHGIWQYHSFATWRAARKLSKKYVVFTHGMLDPWFKKKYPLKHLKKWLYWPWADYRVLRDAEAVLFTSQQEAELARKSFWLYRANDRVIPYGTADIAREDETSCTDLLNTFPELKGKRVLLFLSRIHPKKGCDILIEAFAQIADHDEQLHLVMAGPDQVGWMDGLKEKSRQLGIKDRITWAGMLEGNMKTQAYQVAEVFALPSHQENFGIVVSEALSFGCPVLISNQVNIYQEILQCKAGFVGNDDQQGTLKILTDWLKLTKEERKQMSKCARTCFLERFEIGASAKALASICEELRK
jgi:glycosyltransferase involved in cell wall biosynthesis